MPGYDKQLSWIHLSNYYYYSVTDRQDVTYKFVIGKNVIISQLFFLYSVLLLLVIVNPRNAVLLEKRTKSQRDYGTLVSNWLVYIRQMYLNQVDLSIYVGTTGWLWGTEPYYLWRYYCMAVRYWYLKAVRRWASKMEDTNLKNRMILGMVVMRQRLKMSCLKNEMRSL